MSLYLTLTFNNRTRDFNIWTKDFQGLPGFIWVKTSGGKLQLPTDASSVGALATKPEGAETPGFWGFEMFEVWEFGVQRKLDRLSNDLGCLRLETSGD